MSLVNFGLDKFSLNYLLSEVVILLPNLMVSLGENSYPISIGVGILDDKKVLSNLPRSRRAFIITNTTVAKFYLSRLQESLSAVYGDIGYLVLPDGEVYKNFDTLNLIFDALLLGAYDRSTVVFALGGGVIGDMAGFASASYMRGVRFVQVPTTLLAQVDSSVGGKTGINHPLGKNMIGAFYQPKLVICDIDLLKTLPAREISAGLAEVIKYGPIFDMKFFDWLEKNIDGILIGDNDAISFAVRRSCEIKAEVVAKDERESGARACLNFGHTFGHAIEAGLGYGTWLHGEGVGCGMVMAAVLSQRLNMVDSAFVQRLISLVARAGLPTVAPVLRQLDNAGRYLELMRVDKKADGGEIRFVLIDGQGNATLRTAPDALVREVIDACCVPL